MSSGFATSAATYLSSWYTASGGCRHSANATEPRPAHLPQSVPSAARRGLAGRTIVPIVVGTMVGAELAPIPRHTCLGGN
jgi:hypothetical protein